MLWTRGMWLAVVIAIGCQGGGDHRPARAIDAGAVRPEVRWRAMLEDPTRQEQAVSEIRSTCDPARIPLLVEAWRRDHATRVLRAIVALAQPLGAKEAATLGCPTSAADRAAHWDEAMPALVDALARVDGASAPSVDAGLTAAEALGEVRQQQSVHALIAAVERPTPRDSAAQRVRAAAIEALGALGDPDAGPALARVVRAAPDAQPRAVVEAAVGALGAVRARESLPTLVELLYTQPELTWRVERAFLVLGPDAAGAALRKILRGEAPEIDALIRERQLDRSCDGGDCVTVAPRDYVAALALGALHDRAAIDDLRAALARPAVAVTATGVLSTVGVLQALYDLGGPAAAPDVLALALDRTADPEVRAAAASAYGALSVDGAEPAGARTGLAVMCGLAGDTRADVELQEAAIGACANLADDLAEAAPLQALAASARAKLAKATGRLVEVYRSVAREYEAAIAGIEVAARCGADGACLVATFDAQPEEVAQRLVAGGWLVEDASWTADDRKALVASQRRRAALELARLGASEQVVPVLDKLLTSHVGLDVRPAVLRMAAQIAPRPCPACVTAIEASRRAVAVEGDDDGSLRVAALLAPPTLGLRRGAR